MNRSLLILRTAEAAARTAQKAEALGFVPTTGVLWQALPLAGTPSQRQACTEQLLAHLARYPDAPVLLTSGNGVSALKALLGASEPLAEALASRWAFLVGTATAEALRGIQFSKTFTATGDGAGLARLVLSELPEGKVAIHLCGTLRADEPSLTLTKNGWQVVPVPLYEMRPASRLPQSAQAFLADSQADERYILLLSAQAVRVFAGLLEQESRQKYRLAGIVVLVPSESVARTVRDLLAGFSVRQTDEFH